MINNVKSIWCPSTQEMQLPSVLSHTSPKQLPLHLDWQLCPYVPLLQADIKYKHYQMKLKSHQTKTQILVVFNCIRYIWYYQYPCNDFIYLFCMVLFFATLVHIPVHNFQLCDYRYWNRGRLHNPQNRLCHTFQLHILQKITNQ